MFELTAAVGDLSTPVKVGWTVWLAWGVVSLGWYRHSRVAEHAAPALPSRHTPPPAADTQLYEEGPMYSAPTGRSYGEPTGSPYDDSTGSTGAAH